MIGIYAIVNKHNRKVYVGQSVNIQKRFKQHMDALERSSHHSKKLQKDYDELGIGNFTFEIIELCTKEQLDEKEKDWMTKFDSIRNGYNVQDPGTKVGWLFKRKTQPSLTIRSELVRIFRELSFNLIEGLEEWLKAYKEETKVYAVIIAITVFVIFLIGLGFVIKSLTGWGVTAFYAISCFIILFITGNFWDMVARKDE